MLCQYLNASDSVMNGLEYSKDEDSIKRFKCLTDVYNNQSPDWETVVGVVGNYPISDQREACRIAMEYIGMEETECRCIISARNKTGIGSVDKKTRHVTFIHYNYFQYHCLLIVMKPLPLRSMAPFPHHH